MNQVSTFAVIFGSGCFMWSFLASIAAPAMGIMDWHSLVVAGMVGTVISYAVALVATVVEVIRG